MGFDGTGHARLRPQLLDLRRLERSTGAGPRAAKIRLEAEVATGTGEGLIVWMGERSRGFFGDYEGYFFALGGGKKRVSIISTTVHIVYLNFTL